MAGRRRGRVKGFVQSLVGGGAERVAVLLVLAVGAASLGALDSVPRAWGFQVWRYHPAPLAGLAVACATALCLRPVRERLLEGIARAAGSPWRPWSRGVALLVLLAVLWLLRERRLFGDSKILLFSTVNQPFHLPDVGATWLFHVIARLGTALGISSLDAVQAALCLAGAGTIVCLTGLAATVAPSRGRALGFVVLVLAGGLLRVLAGHVEVYAFVLFAASAFLWSGCAYLELRTPLWRPALAFGIGLWLHPSFLFLAPSLALLAASRRRDLLVAGAVAAAPLVLFALAIVASGDGGQLSRAYEALLAIATGGESCGGRWLRPPFAEPGPGTRWAALSPPHLRYLLNCAFLLAPTALPLVVGFGLFAREREPATATTRFLALAALGGVAYACVLRPIWGPYDWDLFSLTALCGTCLAAHLWARSRSAEAASLGLLAGVAAFLLVALPFLAIGVHASGEAGPLAHGRLDVEADEGLWDALDRTIAPWL